MNEPQCSDAATACLREAESLTHRIHDLVLSADWESLDEALDRRLASLEKFSHLTTPEVRARSPLAEMLERLREQDRQLTEFIEREKADAAAALTQLRRHGRQGGGHGGRPYRDRIADATVLDRHA